MDHRLSPHRKSSFLSLASIPFHWLGKLWKASLAEVPRRVDILEKLSFSLHIVYPMVLWLSLSIGLFLSFFVPSSLSIFILKLYQYL
jgi:hypothetical protein